MSLAGKIVDVDQKSLTNLIREKSELDGDGATLVGQAFGGSSPKIKLNRMQTNSERDEQKGFEQLLRGIYAGIRNPRAHENYQDDKNIADTVICFIDYVIERIATCEIYFSLDEFKKRVFDPLFVERDDYAEVIVSEIPYDNLEDAASCTIREREQGDPKKLQFFFKAIFNRADEEQTKHIVDVFSEELRSSRNSNQMINLIRYLPELLWSLVDNDVKLRSESSMIESLKEGKIDIFGSGIESGQFGTWAAQRGKYFSLQRELSTAIIELLWPNWYTQNYVAEYFFFNLSSIITEQDQISE